MYYLILGPQPAQTKSLLCPQPVSLVKACKSSTHAGALNFSYNFGWLYGPIPATACFSSRSILTLVLADSHRDLRLNDLLSLPLAPPGSSGGHSYPQGQDGQQQQPGPRTPEHLETVRGETPSPGGKLPPSLVPFAACGKSLFQCLLGVDASKVRVRGWGKGQVEGRRGRRGRKRNCGCGSRHASGVPSAPPVQRCRRGRPSQDSRGLYGTVPSRPPRGPGVREEGPDGLPPPSSCRRRRGPRGLAAAPSDVRGL